MKKIFALLLALCMIFALAACGEPAQKEETEKAEEAEAAETVEKEEAPAEEAPAEEAPTEEAPTEEAPTEEAPVEETPVEEAPVEETPVEETPVEEAPAEEAFSVVGTWAAPIDLVKVMTTASPETAAMFGEDPIFMEMLLSFAEDGTVKADVNLDEAIPAIKAAMVPYMTQMIEEQYGMSLEDFETAMGMSLDELLDQQLNPEAMKESFNNEDMNGTYAVDGDKVIINDEPDNALTIRDDSLVLDAPEMGEIVFTRK